MNTRLIAAVVLAACAPHGDTGALPPGAGLPAGGTPTWTCDHSFAGRTVGLLSCTPEASPGYTLFAPMYNTTTYLVDLEGRLVHSWDSHYLPGESAYLEPNGHLLRTAEDNADSPFRNGGAAGRLQEFDWDGEIVWEFVYKGGTFLSHHDVERLPGGNVVIIAWEAIDRDAALALGRDPEKLGPDGMWGAHLIEVDPVSDEIVWEWHALDHVVQERDPAAPNYAPLASAPGRVDIDRTWAFGGDEADWNHVNGVDYNEALDQLVISAHNQNEVWILDHGTSTAEARSGSGGRYGKGGELLYRWGRPENYGLPGEQQLSGQHDPEWIPVGSPGEGNLLVMNNGNAFGYSSVVELELPVSPDGSYDRADDAAFGPLAPVWMYSDPQVFFSGFISGSQRLPSGNTLICEGDAGRVFEVTPDGRIVWEYVNPVGPLGPVEQGFEFGGGGMQNAAFRADRYPPDYPAFSGRDLAPKGTVER